MGGPQTEGKNAAATDSQNPMPTAVHAAKISGENRTTERGGFSKTNTSTKKTGEPKKSGTNFGGNKTVLSPRRRVTIQGGGQTAKKSRWALNFSSEGIVSLKSDRGKGKPVGRVKRRRGAASELNGRRRSGAKAAREGGLAGSREEGGYWQRTREIFPPRSIRKTLWPCSATKRTQSGAMPKGERL